MGRLSIYHLKFLKMPLRPAGLISPYILLKPEAGMDRPCLKTAHYNIGTLEQYAAIAQLTRASGSYPLGRWFESSLRYQVETQGLFLAAVNFSRKYIKIF